MIRKENAGPKSDGRNVSLPGGAQAEDKTQSAGWQASLVGMRDDGGIEQGSGFERIFGQEIRADEQLSLLGDHLIGREGVAHQFESFEEDSADVLMPL